MTIKIAIMSILLLALNISNAQTSVTAITGVHSSTTSTNGDVNSILTLNPLRSINLGLLVEQALDDKLSITTGLISRKKGFVVEESMHTSIAGLDVPLGVKVINTINYVEVPAILKYRQTLTSGLQAYVGAGPSLGYARSGSIDLKARALLDFNVMSTPLELGSHNYNRTELLGNVLAGVKIPYGSSGHWLAEINYTKGFTDFVSEDFMIDAGGKHDGWTFNVGYGINF